MKRWLVWTTVPVALLASLTVTHNFRQKRRAASYQAILSTYSRDLALGLTRQDVKEYLRWKRRSFSDACCFQDLKANAVAVEVGEEWAPWYCSERTVYIMFEFAFDAPDESRLRGAAENDVLKNIHLEAVDGGCL